MATTVVPIVGAPPAATSFSDNFNRSNRSLLGDNGWFGTAGDADLWQILNNEAYHHSIADASAIDGYSLLSRNALSDTKHVVQARFVSGNNGRGIFWGYQNANDFYYARISGGSLSLRRWTGVRTTVGGAVNVAEPEVIRVEHDFVTGDLSLYIGGNLNQTVPSQTLTRSGSKVGLVAFDSSVEVLDDFYHSAT